MSRIQELKRILSLALQDARWRDALSVLEKLLKQEENQPAYHNQIGDVLLKMGQQADAIESFLRGVESYRELAMYPNGAALCKKILRLEPGQREATWLLGELKTRQGFLGDGAERMLEALHYFAEDPSITQDVLAGYLQLAEELQSGNKEILEFVATAYAQLGDSKQARDVTLRVADIEERTGNDEKAAILRQLAKSFVLEDMPEEMDEDAAAGGEEEEPVLEIGTPPDQTDQDPVTEEVADAAPLTLADGVSDELESAIPEAVVEVEALPTATGESEPAKLEAEPDASHVEREPAELEAEPDASHVENDPAEPDQVEPVLATEQAIEGAAQEFEILEVESTSHGSGEVVDDRKLNEDDLLRTIDGSQTSGGSDVELFTTQAAQPDRLESQSPADMSSDSSSTTKSQDELFDMEMKKLGLVEMDVEVLSAEPLDPDAEHEEVLEISGTSLDSEPAAKGDVEHLTITLQEALSGSGEDDLDMTVHGLEIQSAGEMLLGRGEDEPAVEVKDSVSQDENALGDEAVSEQTSTPAEEGGAEAGEDAGVQVAEEDCGSFSSLNRFMKTDDAKPRTVGLTTTIGEALQTDDIDQVLREFRDQMAEQMGDMSCEEHYQLGVSYMEMDLFEEALYEFSFTMDHPTLSMKSREWMARCYLKQNRPQELIQFLGDYLSREAYPRKSLVELYYLIGQAYQALERNELAVDSFTKVYTLNPEFRDVKARLELLTSQA